ncbi:MULTISPECIES: hypothetical protein [unclassified Nocardiopsis]|uniref:hypothetical protein n=1 Tax=unclassified Nocardiopsis TaxID=2649073 RepID=UPI00135B2995|nr:MULTISPECIES: hypothetical protein [unclassified Nocardiopsis]
MSERHALASPRGVGTDVLEVACYGTGSTVEDTVLPLHGFPYGIHGCLGVERAYLAGDDRGGRTGG